MRASQCVVVVLFYVVVLQTVTYSSPAEAFEAKVADVFTARGIGVSDSAFDADEPILRDIAIKLIWGKAGSRNSSIVRRSGGCQRHTGHILFRGIGICEAGDKRFSIRLGPTPVLHLKGWCFSIVFKTEVPNNLIASTSVLDQLRLAEVGTQPDIGPVFGYRVVSRQLKRALGGVRLSADFRRLPSSLDNRQFGLVVGIPSPNTCCDSRAGRDGRQTERYPLDQYLLPPVRLGVGAMLFFGGMLVFGMGIARGSAWALIGWAVSVGAFAVAFQAAVVLIQQG